MMPRMCVRVNLFLCCLDHQFIIQFFLLWISSHISFVYSPVFAHQKQKKKNIKEIKRRVEARTLLRLKEKW